MPPEGLFPDDAAPEVIAWARRLRDEFPRFRLVAKEESGFMRAIYRASLMRFWNRRFMDDYTTTIGYSVYMPVGVRQDAIHGVRVLRHERVHIDQFRRHPVWFPVSYLLFLPAFVTMRARWELEAYIESMRAELEDTGQIPDSTLDFIEERFTGPDYLYMDIRKKRVRAQLEAAREALIR